MANSQGDLQISEVNPQHLVQINDNLTLRTRLAEWIGASTVKAALFPGRLMYAITQRGHLYVIQRDGAIIGAAFMKYVHKTLCGFPLHPVNWAVLYGLGSDDSHAFDKLYEHVRFEAAKRQIEKLYLGKRLRENPIKRARVYLVDRGFGILKEQLPQLDLGPSEVEMRFYRVAR